MSLGRNVNLGTGRCDSAAAGCAWLRAYVTDVRAQHPDARLLAVFDIDDTLLVETPSGELVSNTPVVDLYHHCLNVGVKVHIVTARSRHARSATLEDLHGAGVEGWRDLHMMHDRLAVDDVAPWKERIRWHTWIASRGDDDAARLLFTVGDQWWDLLGTDETIEQAQDMYGDDENATILLTHPPGMEPAEILLKLPSHRR